MDYESFKLQLLEKLKEAMAEQSVKAEASLMEMLINNGVKKEGIVIRAEPGVATQAYYPEYYFQGYKRGRTLDSIVADIKDHYLSHCINPKEKLPFDVMNYDAVKKHLLLQLVSRGSNEEMLQFVPHHDLENTDLTAIMKVKIGSIDSDGLNLFRVENNMLELWGVSAEALYQDALANMMELAPPTLSNMRFVMEGIMGVDLSEDNFPEDMPAVPYDMYVLSNKIMMYGASMLLYPEVMAQAAARLEADLFILPSSTHEAIVLRDTGEWTVDELQAMVISINHSQVPEEEVLSDEVYVYDRETQSLSMATSREKTVELKARILADMERGDEMEAEESWER